MPKRLPISRKALRALSIVQLVELGGLVRELIQRAKADEKLRASSKRDVTEENIRDNRTYRLVSIRCGKENCKCASGKGHGPYWYAFWSEGGKTRSKYVGKKRPEPTPARKS
jgi:hypothetical protein